MHAHHQRPTLHRLLCVFVTLVAVWFVTASPVAAQVVVRQEAPSEIRILVQALATAANGDAAAWETFAQAHYAPALLKRETAAQRAAFHAELAGTFGTVTITGVRREGPDAPLQVMVDGAKGRGTIRVALDGDSPKISALRVESGSPTRADGLDGLPPVPVNRTLTADEIDRRLSGYFEPLASRDVFSGVALVARHGVPVFLKAYGVADRETQSANTTRTRFNIGSINKIFTQIAIRTLIADGRLSATDTLGTFFPDYPQAASRGATVEQLLTHRAGIADFFGPQFASTPKSQFDSNADYFTFVGSLPPAFAPGERTQYCNGCYVALGAIIENVSGMPYERFVAERIFARAEMNSTGFPRTDRPAADMAIGYTRRNINGDSAPQPVTSNAPFHGVTGSAAGGGYATALDLLRFVQAVKAGRFPGTEQDLGIAGGAPGVSAVVEARGEWTVIVLANVDPPLGERLGVMIADALER